MKQNRPPDRPPMTRQEQYINNHKRRKHQITAWKLAIFLAFLFQWELTTRFDLVNSFIFSSPSRILNTCIEMAGNGQLFFHVGITLGETLVSFFLVTGISILVSMLLWYFTMAAEISEPYLVILNSLPKSALAPLFIVWFGTGFKTIVIAGMSVAIFGSVISLYQHFRQTDPELIKLIYTLGGGRRQVLTKVLLPGSLPAILSGMKVNIGLCLVGVIIGEFLAARQGLGYLIIYGSQVFKLDWVLMAIFILCVIAMGLYKGVELLEKRWGTPL